MRKGLTVTRWTGCSDGSLLLPILNVPPGKATMSGSVKEGFAGRVAAEKLVGGTIAACCMLVGAGFC